MCIRYIFSIRRYLWYQHWVKWLRIVKMLLVLLIQLRINPPPSSSLRLSPFLSCSLFWFAGPYSPGGSHKRLAPNFVQLLQGHKLTQAGCTLHAQRKMAKCQTQWRAGEEEQKSSQPKTKPRVFSRRSIYLSSSKRQLEHLQLLLHISEWNEEYVGRQIIGEGFVWIFHDLIAQKWAWH